MLFKFEDFTNIKNIYNGQFVTVYSANYKNHRNRVAIKSLRYDNDEYVKEIVHEVCEF